MSELLLTRRSFLASTTAVVGAASIGGLAAPALAKDRRLVVISDKSGDQRVALEKIVAEFETASGIKVSLNNMDTEAHKTAIRNYLVASPPDISFWFSGERMRGFVDRQLFADIGDLVEKEHWADVMPTLASTSVNGRPYGLPLGGPLWGLWYRQDTFDEFGLEVPRTFDDFFTLQKKAASAGIAPVAIGTKNLWPTGGWFDHMNLRINGLDHHMDLMNGKIAYTDASVKKVFDAWAQLIDAGMFVPNHTSFAWDQAGALIVQKKAALIDLAAFVKYAFPPEEQHLIQFAPFPTIDASVPQYEDFSVNSVHVPAKAQHPEEAREFLSFLFRPENLKAYAMADGSIPGRSDIDMSEDRLVAIQQKAMKNVAGTAQYFDRDTNPDVAQAGMKGFQEFMVHPDRAERVLAEIERTRSRVYGAL